MVMAMVMVDLNETVELFYDYEYFFSLEWKNITETNVKMVVVVLLNFVFFLFWRVIKMQ